MIHRYLAVDVFRGLTIMLMIIVNSLPISPHTTWLQHSEWNGCRLADWVFPFFLIIMGISIQLRSKPIKLSSITKRVFILFSLGLMLNAIPHFHHIRYLGVLQRLAICYGVVAIISWHSSQKTQLSIIVASLLLYWLISIWFPTTFIGSLNKGCTHNFIGCFDQLVLGSDHLYRQYFDPEGMISTIPAVSQTLIGCMLGSQLKHAQGKPPIFLWLIAGAGLLGLGYIWNFYFAWNKSIWSSSYVLWTSGLALWSLCACQCLKGFKVAERFGQHSLLIFIVHVLGLKLIYYFKFKPIILHFLQGIFPLDIASLFYAFTYLGLCFLFLTCYQKGLSKLYRFRIK